MTGGSGPDGFSAAGVLEERATGDGSCPQHRSPCAGARLVVQEEHGRPRWEPTVSGKEEEKQTRNKSPHSVRDPGLEDTGDHGPLEEGRLT